MKIIIEFYSGKTRIDAWVVDTRDLAGKPPVLKVHLYKADTETHEACTHVAKRI